MVFCCFESPYSNAKDAYQQQTSDGLGGSYPGARRLNKTGGNALQAAQVYSSQEGNRNENFGSYQQRSPENQYTNDNLIEVIIPDGVTGGQSIQVSAPDGRTVEVEVPHGMSAGSSFMVELPSVNVISSVPATTTTTTQSYANVSSPYENGKLHVMRPSAPIATPSEPFATAYPVGPNTNTVTVQAVPVSSAPSPFVPQPPSMPPSSTQLLKVQVPHGTPGGSTIHVQVPGENRTISAQVPHGVTEFHVSYEPISNAQSLASPVVRANPVRAVQAPTPSLPQASPGDKLLLVQVPPGTAPGSTLHVAIPGEHGRVVSAIVPPGVSQFHVSYTPQNTSMMANASRGTPNRQFQPNNSNYENNYNNNNNNSGGGMGSVFLPLLGGAALGAGLMSIFDHSQNNAYDDTAAYQQNDGGYGYDGGGGDYGGGFDTGGFDTGGFDSGGFGGDY